MRLLHIISKKYGVQLSKHLFIGIDPRQHKTIIHSSKYSFSHRLVKRKYLWIFDRYSNYVKEWRTL